MGGGMEVWMGWRGWRGRRGAPAGGTYHVGEEGGGMFVEADDPLAQTVPPEAVGEGSQLPLHLHARVHAGKKIPEG